MTDTTATPAPDREAIRAELEAARAGYHELLQSISPEDFKQRSANRSWKVGQLMWHLAWGMGFIPQSVDQCRKGKGFNPPQGISNFVNTWLTRVGSRGATAEAVAKKYDESHQKVLAALDTVKDDEWAKGSRQFSIDYTVESTFHIAKEHLDEHRADILKGLGRQ
jgi:uncharacterized damage-inducible protein DinB